MLLVACVKGDGCGAGSPGLMVGASRRRAAMVGAATVGTTGRLGWFGGATGGGRSVCGGTLTERPKVATTSCVKREGFTVEFVRRLWLAIKARQVLNWVAWDWLTTTRDDILEGKQLKYPKLGVSKLEDKCNSSLSKEELEVLERYLPKGSDELVSVHQAQLVNLWEKDRT
jgi:hypothetical protein